jgi:polyisoprenoid-binding protein YceI
VKMDLRAARWTAAVILAASTAAMSAQTKDWNIDPAHSEADFAIKHMSISTVHGTFHGITGVIKFDATDVTKSSVEATIDVSSVDTGVAARDSHLKSPDFFDASKYPTMTFKSTSVTKDGDHYNVNGNLTLHGVTKPVVLKMDEPGKEEPGMDGKSVHRGFEATTTLDRKEFGLTWNGALKSGDSVLGDDVKIELDIEAVQM